MAAAKSSIINVSLFEHLREHFGSRLNTVQCTKATLVHLSHTLEDLVLREKLPAILFTGFQESSHWREETERYRALADVAQQVCIFAGGTLPPESNEKEIHVTLRGDDPLRQEWFVCILSPKFSVVLCGQDRQAPFDQEATRQFATLWTLDPVIVNEVLEQCEAVVEHYRPERAQQLRDARKNYPPCAPDPGLMTDFTLSMINFEEQLHQSLLRTRQLLEQQLRWQEDMQRLLVHDLRTPLQSVLLGIQMTALTTDMSDEQRTLLAMAEAGTRRASEMVQTMLDASKLEHGQFPINVQPLQLPDLIERAVSGVQVLAERANIRLKRNIGSNVALIWGDSALLERIVVNLLQNAIKFTPAEGAITVSAKLHPDRKHVEFSVRDTGRGIPPEARDKIFERLAQVSDDDRRNGSGLGLYFCRLAAEAHGGTIRVYSEIGRGSTFTVTLPLRPQQLASVLASA